MGDTVQLVVDDGSSVTVHRVGAVGVVVQGCAGSHASGEEAVGRASVKGG